MRISHFSYPYRGVGEGTVSYTKNKNKGISRRHKEDKREDTSIRDNEFRVALEDAGIPYENAHARKQFGERRFLARITRERTGADRVVFGDVNQYGNPITTN